MLFASALSGLGEATLALVAFFALYQVVDLIPAGDLVLRHVQDCVWVLQEQFDEPPQVCFFDEGWPPHAFFLVRQVEVVLAQIEWLGKVLRHELHPVHAFDLGLTAYESDLVSVGLGHFYLLGDSDSLRCIDGITGLLLWLFNLHRELVLTLVLTLE